MAALTFQLMHVISENFRRVTSNNSKNELFFFESQDDTFHICQSFEMILTGAIFPQRESENYFQKIPASSLWINKLFYPSPKKLKKITFGNFLTDFFDKVASLPPKTSICNQEKNIILEERNIWEILLFLGFSGPP